MLTMTTVSAESTNAIVAIEAGLRYVSDVRPGLSRVKNGKSFTYRDQSGMRLTDKATLNRIRHLAIPPAWTDVWICPNARGHIQAVGRDARGRKQYRYHPDWVATRDSSKFDRMIEFGKTLPKLRACTDGHLRRAPLCRERVLATIVRIMEKTAIRVGNEEYARTNGSYGLTTMKGRHARANGRRVVFNFRAKSGVLQHVELDDARLAAMVKKCQDLPGQTLFQYLDDTGTPREVDSSDVNEYLRSISGSDFTAKDFRTWIATVLAATELAATAARADCPTSVTGRKRELTHAIAVVATQLGNTQAVCRKSYIHPAVMNGFLDGRTIDIAPGSKPGVSACEAAVIKFLSKHYRKTPSSMKRAS